MDPGICGPSSPVGNPNETTPISEFQKRGSIQSFCFEQVENSTDYFTLFILERN